MSNLYGATALTGGGTKALDGSTYYDGDDLVDKDGAIVITDSSVYAFHLDASSGAAENSPLVISPDANAGTKRWLLKSGVFAGLTLYGDIIMPNDGTIGQSDGPLLTFNNTDNILKIMGCNVGFGNTDPKAPVDVYRAPSNTKGDNSIALSFGHGSDMWGMRLGASDSYSFHLDRKSSGTWYQALSIQRSNGNMGIGIWPLTKLTVEGTITLKERAEADADTAAYGQIWVKNTTPNQLWFTRDDGTDVQIA